MGGPPSSRARSPANPRPRSPPRAPRTSTERSGGRRGVRTSSLAHRLRAGGRAGARRRCHRDAPVGDGRSPRHRARQAARRSPGRDRLGRCRVPFGGRGGATADRPDHPGRRSAQAGDDRPPAAWRRRRITPWNFPMNIPVEYVGPALASGNAVILKPAPSTAGIAALLAECIVEAGVPDGLFSLLTGPSVEMASAARPAPARRRGRVHRLQCGRCGHRPARAGQGAGDGLGGNGRSSCSTTPTRTGRSPRSGRPRSQRRPVVRGGGTDHRVGPRPRLAGRRPGRVRPRRRAGRPAPRMRRPWVRSTTRVWPPRWTPTSPMPATVAGASRSVAGDGTTCRHVSSTSRRSSPACPTARPSPARRRSGRSPRSARPATTGRSWRLLMPARWA